MTLRLTESDSTIRVKSDGIRWRSTVCKLTIKMEIDEASTVAGGLLFTSIISN